MTASPNIHWTTDEHLLAHYVLGRVDPAQRSGLEQHLRDCPECRGAVEAEQQLAAGVRRAGRDGMKRRLVQHLNQKRIETNWFKIAGVAAALVLLLTVGIYNKWFFSNETRLADSRAKTDSVAPATEATPNKLEPEANQLEKKQFAHAVKPSANDKLDRAEAKGTGGAGSGIDKKKKDAQGERTEAAHISVERGNILVRKDQPIAVAMEPEGVWVEGAVVDVYQNRGAADKVLEKSTEDVRQYAPNAKREPAALMSAAAQQNLKSASVQEVVVTQRSMADLPSNQRRAQQVLSQVPTFFRSTPGGISMTASLTLVISKQDREIILRTRASEPPNPG